MNERERWRGTLVPAGLFGASAGTLIAVVMSGSGNVALVRDVYTTMEDCLADYPTGPCTAGMPPDQAAWALGPKYRTQNGFPAPCGSDDSNPGRATSTTPKPEGPLIETRVVQRGGFATRCANQHSGSSGGHTGGYRWNPGGGDYDTRSSPHSGRSWFGFGG
jgi:uncharacterized protein YgiB involved in biofilm formation